MLMPAPVLCSVLLPFAFLLDLHRTGYGSEERAAVVISNESGLGKHEHLEGGMKHKLSKDVSKVVTSGLKGISNERSSRSKYMNLSVKIKSRDQGRFLLSSAK